MVEFVFDAKALQLDAKQVQHRSVVTVTGDADAVCKLHCALMGVAGELSLVSSLHGGQFNFDPNDFVKAAVNPGVSKKDAALVSELHDAVVGDSGRVNPGALARVKIDARMKSVMKLLPKGEAGEKIMTRVAQDMVGFGQRNAGKVLADDPTAVDPVAPAIARAQLTLKLNDVPVGNWGGIIGPMAEVAQSAVNAGQAALPEKTRVMYAMADYVKASYEAGGGSALPGKR